jgi:hypothetical protein
VKLHQKILEVMKDVSYLQKDDQVAFGNTKYKAISEEKVTSTIRTSLIKHGLVIIPIEQEHKREHFGDKEKSNYLSTVDVKYKIVDVDTGEYEIAVSSGTGADTQDKGVGKAMTYAYKYLLLRTFAIPTGDDPDKISNEEIEHKQKMDKPINSKQVGEIRVLTEQIKELAKVSNEDIKNTLKLEIGEFMKMTELTAEKAARAIVFLTKWRDQHKQG